MSRPGGSGLISHLRRGSKKCGREWEKGYWKETIEKWDVWNEEFRVGLVNKWIEVYRGEEKNCMICEKIYAGLRGVKQHVRKEEPCYREWLR